MRVGLLSLAAVLAGVLFLFSKAKGERQDACHATNELRQVLRGIIAKGDESLRAFKAEGTITQTQLDRALSESARNRVKLADKDCG